MKYLLLLCLFAMLISCQNKETAIATPTDPDSYQIQLQEQQAEQVLNQKFGTAKPAAWLDERPSFLKDFPEADTLEVRLTRFLGARKIKELYANGSLDSIKHPMDSIKRGVYVVNGYRDGQQFVVIDANNNYTFKDDTVFYFKNDFKHRIPKDPLLRDSIPFVTIVYQDFDGEQLIEKTMKVKPLPEKLPYEEFLNKEQLKQLPPRQLKDSFAVKLFYQQDWEGQLQLEDKDYVVNVMKWFQGSKVQFYEGPREAITIDPQNQGYTIKDSIKLGNAYYILDSLTPKKDQLFIRKLDIEAPKWGYRTGETTVDFAFENIDAEQKKVSELFDGKEYVLIDFWGTWCGPCTALTPDLVRMSQEYENKMALLSIAFDQKKEPLVAYIAKNNMAWEHVFVEGYAKANMKEKPRLIKNFAVEGYPTFILLNSKLEIVHRGTGKPALDKIEGMIKS